MWHIFYMSPPIVRVSLKVTLSPPMSTVNQTCSQFFPGGLEGIALSVRGPEPTCGPDLVPWLPQWAPSGHVEGGAGQLSSNPHPQGKNGGVA